MQNTEQEEQNDIKQIETPEITQDNPITLTPSMLDSDGESIQLLRPDLSAIIPKQSTQNQNPASFEITSKDKELKSDGTIILGILKSEDEAILTSDAAIPEQIDIKKRKEELQKHRNKKENKKEHKKRIKTKAQVLQGRTALVAFLLTLALAGVGIYIWKRPTEMDFKALPVQIELGDKLPASVKKYVKPGIGTEINEMAYTIDTSQVIIDEIGSYPYTLTYKGVEKSGTINIVDTTKPNLLLRDSVSIIEGTTFTPETFVLDCIDFTGCNYSFEDENITEKYKKPGNYVVHIAARDAYDNKEVKQANLIIESTGMVKKYKKTVPYNSENGYSAIYIYELHYTEIVNSSIILNGTYNVVYTYEDEEKYKEARNEHYGELNYTVDDEQKTITLLMDVSTVGYNYSEMNLVHNYLIGDGYSEE